MRRIIAVILFLGILASACATTGKQAKGSGVIEFDPQLISQIKLNKTSKSEILRWFGLPETISTTATGQEVYRYVFQKKPKKTSSVGPRFITLSFVVGTKESTESGYQQISIIFKDNIVVDYTSLE